METPLDMLEYKLKQEDMTKSDVDEVKVNEFFFVRFY
jgi:hypothetical protein